MPTLEFKGKPFVHAHHLSVPFRELVIDADKSLPGAGGPSLDDNLIVHGDNLEALKALLPRYAGKVDCIFIDPPYNTGNEGWAYNDNVNSPLMKAWLGKTVDGEDLERHDKWACMMWPRLTLLRELLSENGSFWMTLDDNEIASGLESCDEIFGQVNRLACAVWEKADSPRMDAYYFSSRHDFLLSYAKSKDNFEFNSFGYTEDDTPEHYDSLDGTRRYYLKPLRSMGGQGESRASRPNLYFPMIAPDKTEVFPRLQDGSDGTWRWSQGKVEREAKRIEWLQTPSGWTPYFRIYADESAGRPPETIFFNKDVGSSRTAKAQIKALFPEGNVFDTPKPVGLLSEIVRLAVSKTGLTLDSFAGSGTTAHAVLAANAMDGGNRKFILIETEDYADTLTAERVRRVAKGYPFKGSQKTELLREPVTWTKLKNADALLAKVASFDNLDAYRFDRIEKTVKDGELIVTGITDCEETAPGLGGSFTYCALGEPMDMARFFDGAMPPAFEQVARYVAYTATGATLDVVAAEDAARADHFVGEAGGYRLHLIYRADAGFMRSDAAMLDMATAERIAAAGATPGAASGKPILVFAAGKYMGQKQLTAMGLTFAQLPYAIHRMLPGDGDGE